MTEPDLPPIAAKLVVLAEDNGWSTAAQWQSNHWDETWVTITVGRWLTDKEKEEFRADGRYGERWVFQAVWHSRNAPAGILRLFGRPLGKTPKNPGWWEYSLREIREIITTHPKPEETT